MGLWFYLFPIDKLYLDISVIVVCDSIPLIVILPFSNILSSIRPSVCSLTMTKTWGILQEYGKIVEVVQLV